MQIYKFYRTASVRSLNVVKCLVAEQVSRQCCAATDCHCKPIIHPRLFWRFNI